MKYLKEFFTSTLFRRFMWNTLAGFLGLVVVYLSGIDWVYAPVMIALINGILKELNS